MPRTPSNGRQPLDHGWELCLQPPAGSTDPGVPATAADWCPAQVPGTAAAALKAAGRAARLAELDTCDVWYRCRFAAAPADPGERVSLVFEGLATLAQVWLNGSPLLESSNMFVAAEAEVGRRLQPANELLIRCAAVTSFLQARRPRPRWRTRLVNHTQLRWLRTSLLGRMPGWAAIAPPCGPWRPVWLQRSRGLEWGEAELRSSLDGERGVVRAVFELRALEPIRLHGGRLQVGAASAPLDLHQTAPGAWQLSATLVIPAVRPWWPHTHGEPQRYPVSASIDSSAGPLIRDFGHTGFRCIELLQSDGGFALKVNGEPVFCRGACWTVTDPLTLTGDAAATRQLLEQVRDAGMNMLRLGGTTYYEADHFYVLCDELGILVWQDWMFASQDYPAEDAGFVASVEAEARQFLRRIQLSPCLALLCGNSEVEQQAAMLGVEPALRRNALFGEVLPRLGASLRPDVPYFPSSPSGGALPFQVDAGAAHYFGVGAYLQPLSDARRCGLRFASECLAFANVPEAEILDMLPGGGLGPAHPAWKAGVPRDGGVGWDFDDVRDHYLGAVYGVDPLRLRYADPARYLYLSRVVSGEVMAAAFAEWRRRGASCAGALVWFLRDLQPGAGWGLLDCRGRPKAAWYYLRRALAPIALLITDEGLNGLALHAVNDGAAALAARLSLHLYRGEQRIAEGSRELEVPAHGVVEVRGDALLGRFCDTNHVYRFGPPGHELVHAVLQTPDGALLGQAFHFPLGHAFPVQGSLGLQARVQAAGDGAYELQVSAQRFAQAVALEAPGYQASDNYFHLAPGASHCLRLQPRRAGARLQASLCALNSNERLSLAA